MHGKLDFFDTLSNDCKKNEMNHKFNQMKTKQKKS
jgi:hypothetical protein